MILSCKTISKLIYLCVKCLLRGMQYAYIYFLCSPIYSRGIEYSPLYSRCMECFTEGWNVWQRYGMYLYLFLYSPIYSKSMKCAYIRQYIPLYFRGMEYIPEVWNIYFILLSIPEVQNIPFIFQGMEWQIIIPGPSNCQTAAAILEIRCLWGAVCLCFWFSFLAEIRSQLGVKFASIEK